MDSPYPNASLTDEGRRASYPYNMHRYQAANNAPSPGTVLKYVTGREWVAVAGAAAASLPLGLAAAPGIAARRPCMALFSLVGFLGSVGICYRKSEARLRGLAPNRATLLGYAAAEEARMKKVRARYDEIEAQARAEIEAYAKENKVASE
eukprot:TRINITY_DN1979_c0_g1_i1.p1 TRINITY_DN1979_c0_g1~~TRINITY_DN1979_c0_g1_i1.p1  ORF type:complete len:150 (+),score=52.03 TRINITY_DN1979_c0_g1_i1:81-530(+)